MLRGLPAEAVGRDRGLGRRGRPSPLADSGDIVPDQGIADCHLAENLGLNVGARPSLRLGLVSAWRHWNCQKIIYVSDRELAVRRLTEQILAHAQGLPEGTLIAAKSLLHLGNRAAIDQALSRLAKRGQFMRAR